MPMLTPKQDARLKKQLEKPVPEEHEMYKGGRKALYLFLTFLMKLLFRMEVVNTEYMPKEGPVLLCANHVKLLDIPLIHLQSKRWVYWVARESLFRFWYSYKLLPWWGASPIDVNAAAPSQIKTIVQRLREGKVLGIFPQGTRCGKIEKLRTIPPKPGTINFAMRTNAYILPCAIDGDFKLFRKTRIIFGKPYKMDKNYLKENDTDLMTESIRLMDTIFALMGKEYPLENKYALSSGRIPDVKTKETIE